MIEVVSAIIEESKNVYYLTPNNIKYNIGDIVIIDTELGHFLARIIKENYFEKEENLDLPLKSVLKSADEGDVEKNINNRKDISEIINFAKNASIELNLDMSFVDAEFNLDKSVLVITYVSEARVDFRDLAKKIAQKYKARIELRQIGVRDKAKNIGGLGPCGLFLCCNSFLSEFNSVSINMAKNQNLALSPNKINGVCGRLLCCLGYENSVYSDLKMGLPKVGINIETPSGKGKVVSVDILKGRIKIETKEKNIIEISKDELK